MTSLNRVGIGVVALRCVARRRRRRRPGSHALTTALTTAAHLLKLTPEAFADDAIEDKVETAVCCVEHRNNPLGAVQLRFGHLLVSARARLAGVVVVKHAQKNSDAFRKVKQ